MKFTLSWLKDHLETDAPLDEIVDKLTMIGLEVEHVEDKAKALAPFTIARVVAAEQHPERRPAARLHRRYRRRRAGAGRLRRAECAHRHEGVFAPPGTYIPGKKITLGVGKIRGVESRGMLCRQPSWRLSDDHDGIIDLPDDAPVGERLRRLGRASTIR